MLTRYLDVLETLANAGAGVTVGQVERKLTHLTRGQVQRIMDELIMINFVVVEKVHYRSNINKNVYHMTPGAMSNMRHIATRYNKTPRQKQFILPESGAILDEPVQSEQ